ncbi:MAG: hypothetical protein EHM43_06535 [Ignavibacteriae bacterium]|nr:MAG: hypothetical protein EHM43_06535 [Ignavibacteriota bacterium]
MATAQWNKLGEMEGGQVQWLDYRDGVVMAGMSYGGLALSYDHGSNWEMIPGTKDAIVTSSCVHGDTIVAGLTVRGFGVTTDRGKSWRVHPYPQRGSTTSSAHIIRGMMFIVNDRSLYRSSNAGLTWSVVIDDLQSSVIAIGDRLVFVRNNLLQYSDDLGEHWNATNTPSAFGTSPRLNSFSMVRDTAYVVNGNNIMMSADFGRTWTVYRTVMENLGDIAFHVPYGLTTTSSRLVRSTSDGFRSYALDTIGLMTRHPHRMSCLTDSVALIATDQGVWGKRWTETRWRPMNRGLTGVQVNAMQEFAGQLIAATQQGLYRSGDKGATWTHVEPERFYQPLTCLWEWRDTMFTGGNDVLRSVDGINWSQSPDGLLRALDNAIATDSIVIGVRSNYLYMSRGSWPADMVSAVSASSPYSAITARGDRFVVSIGTDIWVGDNVNQPQNVRKGPFTNMITRSLALTPSNALIISGWAKVMASYDNFKTAILVVEEGRPLEQTWGVVNIDVPGRGSYQVLSKDEAILLSRNDGRNWSDISAGGPVNQILRFEQIGSTIYALTNGDGIWTLDLLKIVDVEEADNEPVLPSCIAVHTSVDGQQVLTSSHDGHVMITNVRGQLVHTLGPVSAQQQVVLPKLERGLHHVTCSVCKTSKKL